MNITQAQRKLRNAIVNHADEIDGLDPTVEHLISVLGSVIEGVPVDRALGAPGSWGYDTPIGDALLAYLRESRPNPGTDLNALSHVVHRANAKWWQDIETGQPIKRNKGELLALIHSEISEALEGERKDLMDDKLPHRKMAEVELVDALIRILDYAAGFGYDLQGAFEEKMAFNATREDHTHEARRIAGGKQF